MASTYTTRLRIEKPADGEQDDTWGATIRAGSDLIDEAMDGYLAKSVAGSADVTLTSSNGSADESRQRALKFTGTLTGNISVIVPAVEKHYAVWNATAGAFSLTFKPSGGAGIVIPQGYAGDVFTDGTTMYQTGAWVDPANGDDLIIVSADAGASAGPALILHRNSASPADNDLLGAINFDGEDDSSAQTTYGRITGFASDVTDTTEDGGLLLGSMKAGTVTNMVSVTGTGVVVMPSAAASTTPAGLLHVSDPNNEPVVRIDADHATFTDNILHTRSARTGNSAFAFLRCTSDYDGTPDHEFLFRGDGFALAEGTFQSAGLGYAEMFEWADGNPEAEDRIGMTVALDGLKIKPAAAGGAIIGVITGNPTIVGNSAALGWVGRYKRDKFGRRLQNRGSRVRDQDFDSSLPYVPRTERKEWGCVSLLGQEIIRDDQPTDPRWVKMEQRADGISLWLVR